jgi:hypothetical protein
LNNSADFIGNLTDVGLGALYWWKLKSSEGKLPVGSQTVWLLKLLPILM